MIIIKPDAFERRLAACILDRFTGYRRIYSGRMSQENCAEHYKDHIGKPFYRALVVQMISGISLFVDLDMPWMAARIIAQDVRIRLGCEGPRNLIHASDSQEANERETAYWFKGYPL